MAITLLASRGNRTGSEGAFATGATNSPTLTPSGEKTKNNGGILGGIGYVGEKLAVGVVSSLEGMTDYVGSGFAKLFGNDEWAEEIIKTDWFGDWYSHPEEWFNPDKGWQFAGDVAGGIGTSLPAIGAAVGTAAAVVATGGAAGVAIAPGVVSAASGGASFLTAGLGAAGRSTKEAYEESGELTGKEFGYGALTGITEGGIEAVSNIIGMGSGALVKNISKSFAKETGEAIAKQGILKTLGASFAGEAFEEGVSEWIDPYWKRATYDQDAENASLDQIAYSALVGGFSGMLMGGTGYVYDSGKSFINGNRLSQNGGDTEVMETARYFSAFEEQNQTGDEAFAEIKSLSDSLAESLKTTGGKVTTVGQKRQLGALSRANVAASMKSFVAKRAVNIVNNAPVIAERLSAYGYKTPDGKPVSFTAQEITAGYDPANPGSIFSALKTNEKLRSLAVADATGQLMIDSAEFTKSTLMGERLASQVDLNRFVESASKEEIAAVSRALNIESWGELSSESFAEKITEYINAGGVQQTIRANEVKNALKAMPAEGARPIPKLINLASDGSRRYSDGDLDIAVSKQGDSYTVYNYSTDTLSKSMTRKEINSFLREYSTQKETVLERERKQIRAAEQVRAEIAEVDSYARENITDYANLNAPSQSMIRRLIREGRAKGVSESDLLTLAKISAHSGIDIVFSKEQNYLGVAEDGSAKYADGFYEAESNRIVVNPEGKRSFERLLIHELDHAVRRYLGEDGKVHTTVFKDAIEGVSSEAREKILKTYKSVAASEGRAATVMDETNAYYAEQVLTNRNTLERLIEAKPSLKDKILSFFKGASGDYADIPKLSAAAKKYYRTYKKLFDEFSARNAQNIAAENAEFRMQNSEFYKNAENSQKPPLTNINQGNMNVSGENVRYYAFNDAYSEKDSIKSQLRQNESTVNNMNPVDDINYDVVDKKKSREDAKQLYKSLGYRIDRQNFGIIEISEKEINESSNYLNTKAEFAAWMTVPKVLKRGKLISDHSDHKGGGFPTYTIAAPVIINGVRGNVAVAVKKTGKNRYKTHRILMPDGSQFVYEKNKTNAEPTGSDIILSNKNKGSDISSASINSISQKSANSNPSGENNSKKQFALELDSSGKELSAEQKEYFKDSKVRDADGRLLTVYHGTNNDFYTFEDGHTRTKTRLNFGRGFYFSASRSMAENYIDGSEGRLLECFINLKNPYEVYSNRFDQSDYDTISKLAGETVTVDNVSATLRDLGYDGVIGRKYNGASNPIEIAVAFSPEQIKLTSNASPTNNPDIRYALDIDGETGGISGAEVMGWLKDKPKDNGQINLEATVEHGLPYKSGRSSLTVGEIRKVIANSTKEKVYSKSDALKVVNKLSGTWGLTQRARDEIADTIWQFLNEAPDIEYRRDMAHDIAEYIVAKVLMDSKTENPDALEAAERLSYMRFGIGKLSFTDEDIAELRHAVDEKGLKRLLGRWGFKGTKRSEGTSGGYVASRRIPMEVFVTDVAREMPGMTHLEEMHPAEAFIEIDATYSRAYSDSKDKWISKYWDMPDSEIPSMIKDVEDGIMSAYENVGEKSKFQKLVEERIGRYEKRAERYKVERDEIKGRDRILGLLMNQATKMKNLKTGAYANATQYESEVLRGSVEQLARIQFRGNLNASGTRRIINDLRMWYTEKNGMLEYVDEQNPGYYSKEIASMLDALANGEDKFSKEELLALYDVMAYFTNFVENYGKVWRRGQWVDADVEAKRYVNILQTNETVKVGIMRRVIGSRYMQTFGDPMTVARRMDMYEGGFFTEMLEELREGAMGARIAEMEILGDYDNFLTENRKYIEKTAAEKVIYHGVNVPKMHLISLYMTLKRRHSRPGLAQNGFTFVDTDGKKVRINGFAIDTKDITEAEIDKRAEEQLNIIAEHLTEKDREYIKILEHAYNVEARRLKAERDIQRLGFTNAGVGYYYPIRRGNIAKNIDSAYYMAELDRVSNSSFNKNTVKGARQELYIENADVVFRRHVRAVCQYSYLAPAIESYNRLYNLDVGGNPNHPISVATEAANTWDKGNEYFKKLIADIQGIPAVSGEGAQILSKIRGGYAKYQLGANPKVWFTQLSSLFASTSKLDVDSIIKAASISAEGVDKYCPLAKLRNSENTAVIAQAVLDTRGKRAASNIDRLGDALMAPIGKMDRFVVGRLFAACQAQIEKNGGAKVGTEENKLSAGKLLTEVILETQQNSIATERSAAMRSGNEILRTSTMFTSDSMKSTGRVLDGLGEALTLRQRLKVEADPDKQKTLRSRLKAAEKKLGKSMGAMVGTAVYMACVAELFRFIYNKDKDESTFETMIFDVLGNMLGGLPFIKDAYSKLFEGYDIDSYAYSAINDLIDSVGNLADVAGSIVSADEMPVAERNRAIRNLAYSTGQVLGLPTRNVHNVIYGLTKRFSPTTAFVIDGWFYEKNYQNELNKAIERGDNTTASYILSVMTGERLDEDVSEAVFSEMLALTSAGFKILPRVMPKSVRCGEEEYPLSDGEREAMRMIYSKSTIALERLVSSDEYKVFTDEEKALAIDFISDLYYDAASAEVLGTEESKRIKLIGILPANVLAAYYVKTRGIESDVDESGNAVSGSKRKKAVAVISSLDVTTEQKLLLICASGYALKDGDIRGVGASAAKKRLLRYIINLRGLTVDERAEIAEMCGFEVKNGRIVKKLSFS